MKKKLNPLFAIFLSSTVLFSCGTGNDNVDDGKDSGDKSRVAKGSKVKYGGTLHFPTEEYYITLFPPKVEDQTSAEIINQIHDGLIRFDAKDLSVLPAVAKDWKLDDNQTTYTFYLRDNVKFHDDECFSGGKGRNVVASDVKYSIEMLLNKEHSLSGSYYVKSIVGAESYYNGNADEISGVKVVDDHTVTIEINMPQPSFIYTLAFANAAIIAKEAFDKYGEDMHVGVGPFKYVKSLDTDKFLSLVYNEDYYMVDGDENQLPYLDTLSFDVVSTKIAELEMFRTKDLSVIHGLPTSKIAEVVSENIANFKNNPPKTILEREPEMATQYYELITTLPPFDNVKVRKAFNYAIDRNKLVNEVLNGQGIIGSKGITPVIRNFNGYDYNEIEGYSYDPDLARKLLAEAGYPEGKNFPSIRLEINSGGNVHRMVATEIQRQLFNTLNVNVEVELVSFEDKIEHSKYGKSEMFRGAWVADYPSPESFLSIFYGAGVPESMDEPSHPNSMRYKDPVFDSLYMAGVRSTNKKEQYSYFAAAEKRMMEASPAIILWYGESYTLYHSEVRNFHYNSLNYLDFSEVYLKELSEEEVKEQMSGSGEEKKEE